MFPESKPQRTLDRFDDPAVTNLVAEDAGRVAGFTVCGPSRDEDVGADIGEIHTFFVSPERWRRGAGRALMDSALDDLRRRGYRRCTVWSFAANDRANAFYEACGFARDGAERTEETWAHLLEVRYRQALT